MDESSYSLRSFAPFFLFLTKARFVRNKKKQLPKGAAFIRVGANQWISNSFLDGMDSLNAVLGG
jgi:hypothetical protein